MANRVKLKGERHVLPRFLRAASTVTPRYNGIRTYVGSL